jgi:hypothetical protein
VIGSAFILGNQPENGFSQQVGALHAAARCDPVQVRCDAARQPKGDLGIGSATAHAMQSALQV